MSQDDSLENLRDEEEQDIIDDDDVCEEPVTLGFLLRPENQWSLPSHLFPSKAGGFPAWLDPINLPSGRSCVCDICGNPLQFLLQVYAPISGKESAFHRTLFVFMCPSMSCLLQDQHEQWKKHESGNVSRSVKVFLCQLPRANPFYSSEPPMHDGIDEPLGNGVMGETLWPEHEIITEDEPESDTEELDKFANLLAPIDQVDYETEAVNSLMESLEGDDDKDSWASFQVRIAKAPEQVLRHCRSAEAKPLWPVASGRLSIADIPKCSYCGAQRIFEFQILPQLLYYFGVKNKLDSLDLDWATIAIYTCEASCDANVGYKEEFAWTTQWSLEVKWPQEVIGLLKVRSNGHDLVDERVMKNAMTKVFQREDFMRPRLNSPVKKKAMKFSARSNGRQGR